VFIFVEIGCAGLLKHIGNVHSQR